MYKIFLDQNKIFECNVKIDGASLDKSEARLFLEAENFTLTFKGEIKSDGSVKIPIKKLKGILKEDFTGKILLEVIAEDTVFTPWESEYRTDMAKKVEVSFDSNVKESFTVAAKPKVSFTMKEEKFDVVPHLNEISKIMSKNNISAKMLVNNKPVFNKLVETYCSLNHITDDKNITSIKTELLRIK